MQEKLAMVLLKASEIYEASYAEDHEEDNGYTKTKDQAIDEAWTVVQRGDMPTSSDEGWRKLISLLLSDPLWNDSQEWAKDVLEE